jgi:hypothetical protein
MLTTTYKNKTEHYNQKVFEELDPEELRIMMLQPFEEDQNDQFNANATRILPSVPKYNYIIEPVSVEVNMEYCRMDDKDVRK